MVFALIFGISTASAQESVAPERPSLQQREVPKAIKPCYPRRIIPLERLTDNLKKKYRELQSTLALSSTGALTSIYTTEGGETYTIIRIIPMVAINGNYMRDENGIQMFGACIIDSGKNIESINPFGENS